MHKTQTGEVLWSEKGHAPTRALVFSRDGRFLYSGGGNNLTRSDEGNIRKRLVATGELVGTLRGHDAPVSSLALSPDGTRLLSAGYLDPGEGGCVLRLWDEGSGEPVARLPSKHTSWPKVVFAPDGKQAASVGLEGDAYLWNLEAKPDKARSLLIHR